MTIYNLIDYLSGTIEAIMMFMLFDSFFKRKENLNNLVYLSGIAALTAMIIISNKLFTYGMLNAVVVLVAFFAMSFLYDGNVAIKAVVSLLSLVLMAVIEIMVLYSIVLICKISVSDAIDIQLYRIIGIIISKTLSLMIANTIRLNLKNKQILFRPSYWILFIMMFATSIVAVFLIFRLSYSIHEKYMYYLSVFCSFGLLFSTAFALYLYEHLSKQAEEIYNHQQYEQHLKSQLKHLDEILLSQKQLRKFKHDFSNYIIGLKSYLDNGDLNGAKAYINNLSEKLTMGRNTITTGNTALDAVLNTKKISAENKGIKFTTKIQIPEMLPMDPIDICSVFGNAIDNAIEACEKIQNNNKEIALTILCQNKKMFCKIENTSLRQNNPSLTTSKSDKLNHGFGIETIKTTLSKYKCMPEFKFENDKFILKFVVFLH